MKKLNEMLKKDKADAEKAKCEAEKAQVGAEKASSDAEKGLRDAEEAHKKQKRDEFQKVNAEKAIFGAEKAQSEFRKKNMNGKKDNQDTSKGKVMSKETSDEYIERKPEAVKAIDTKVGSFSLLENSINLELRKQMAIQMKVNLNITKKKTYVYI